MVCAVAYLAKTPEMGLEYGGSGADLELSGYVDANYAGDINTRRSTTGPMFSNLVEGRLPHRASANRQLRVPR
jgi:hypothetical protein